MFSFSPTVQEWHHGPPSQTFQQEKSSHQFAHARQNYGRGSQFSAGSESQDFGHARVHAGIAEPFKTFVGLILLVCRNAGVINLTVKY